MKNQHTEISCAFTHQKLNIWKIKKTIPLTIVSKTMKHLEINLTKEVKDLYNGNYKALMKKLNKI